MNAFYYLNYFIYSWYKKRDNSPLLFSFGTPVLLLYFNFFSFVYWLSILFNFKAPFEYKYIFGLLVLLIAFSYFALYRNNKFREVFSYYNNRQALYIKKRKFARIYIIATILFLLATLVHADIRVDGHL